MGRKRRTSSKPRISNNVLLNTKKKRKSSRIQIPDDILVKVLKSLPAKSLMRFKSVCKTWQTLITDPYFAQLHFEHSQTRLDASYVLFYLRTNSLARSIFPTNLDAVITSGLPTHKFHETLPCTNIVNGLICLYSPNVFELVLLNLTTGEKVNLPCENYFRCGSFFLGFDPRGKEYKVVVIPWKSPAQTAKCVILTLGTNTWRSIPCDPQFGMHKKGAICVSGRIYWKDMLRSAHGQSAIQYFSVRKEKFGVLLTPHRGQKFVYVIQVGKNIAIACRKNYNTHSLWLWIFNHENKDWIKNEIKLGSIPISHLEILGSTGKTGEIVMTAKSRPDYIPELIFYDLGTATFRISKITYPGMPQGIPSDLISYVASAAATNHVENILPLISFKVKEQ